MPETGIGYLKCYFYDKNTAKQELIINKNNIILQIQMLFKNKFLSDTYMNALCALNYATNKFK